MRSTFKIPGIAWWIFGGVMVIYFALPIMFWQFLVSELEKGSFPPEADSIGIPFAGFMFVWFVGLFVFGMIAIFARRSVA